MDGIFGTRSCPAVDPYVVVEAVRLGELGEPCGVFLRVWIVFVQHDVVYVGPGQVPVDLGLEVAAGRVTGCASAAA